MIRGVRYPIMRVYLMTLILSLLFDIGSTIADVFKYNDPYLEHEMNIFLKGRYWPWLLVSGLTEFVIVFVLFSIVWKHRNCLVPKNSTKSFWAWFNSCLYGQHVQPFSMALPKWKNVLVILTLIVLLPLPLFHMIWGLLNTLVFIGYNISFVYQYEKVFIFIVSTPLSIMIMYLSLDMKPNKPLQ